MASAFDDPFMSPADTPLGAVCSLGSFRARIVGMADERTREILDRTLAGERLSDADAETLLAEGNLLALGQAADAVRRRMNDPGVATYLVDRNINYTNVCVYRCQFCAFYRPPRSIPSPTSSPSTRSAKRSRRCSIWAGRAFSSRAA